MVILGVEGQSIALARALQIQGWSAVLADTDADQFARVASEDVEERHIDAVTEVTIRQLVTDRTEAVVAMLGDDEANARALRLATEMGLQGLVARPSNPVPRNGLSEIEHVLTIDPGTAVVSLLEQAVTSPQSATPLLRRDPDPTVSQVRLVNPDLDGTPVHELQAGDDILLLASEDRLTEIRSRLSG